MSRTLAHRLSIAAAATLALAPLAACSQSSTPTGASRRVTAGAGEAVLAHGLVQRVTIAPTSPASGDEVTVRSVVENRGDASVEVVSRICGLDYAGTLVLTIPPTVLKCGGHSQQGPLAPGDSVVTVDLMKVSVGPGAYQLRVRHALTPDAWVTLPVVVLGG